MNKPLTIKICPNCGSDRIAKVCRDWQGTSRNGVYLVPQLEFYECPVCNERVFTPEAVAKRRTYSTAYSKCAKPIEPEAALPPILA